MSNPVSRAIARWLPLLSFRGSGEYWKQRYRLGGDSGAGSGGAAAAYKAEVLNAFVADFGVSSVIEFGCGDGRQLEIARYPAYIGLDISSDALQACRDRFAAAGNMRFLHMDTYNGERADLAMSLDVIFHLVEDETYDEYLQRLFVASQRFVIVYSSDEAAAPRTLKHVRHRNVSADIAARFPDFSRMTDREVRLASPVESNGGVSTRFLMYRKAGTT